MSRKTFAITVLVALGVGLWPIHSQAAAPAEVLRQQSDTTRRAVEKNQEVGRSQEMKKKAAEEKSTPSRPKKSSCQARKPAPN